MCPVKMQICEIMKTFRSYLITISSCKNPCLVKTYRSYILLLYQYKIYKSYQIFCIVVWRPTGHSLPASSLPRPHFCRRPLRCQPSTRSCSRTPLEGMWGHLLDTISSYTGSYEGSGLNSCSKRFLA